VAAKNINNNLSSKSNALVNNIGIETENASVGYFESITSLIPTKVTSSYQSTLDDSNILNRSIIRNHENMLMKRYQQENLMSFDRSFVNQPTFCPSIDNLNLMGNEYLIGSNFLQSDIGMAMPTALTNPNFLGNEYSPFHHNNFMENANDFLHKYYQENIPLVDDSLKNQYCNTRSSLKLLENEKFLYNHSLFPYPQEQKLQSLGLQHNDYIVPLTTNSSGGSQYNNDNQFVTLNSFKNSQPPRPTYSISLQPDNLEVKRSL
jgi:hypothetical protein